MYEPNHDLEIERQHEPAVVLPDPPEPTSDEIHQSMFDQVTYPRSKCCNAAMVNSGVQCLNCGSDGK